MPVGSTDPALQSKVNASYNSYNQFFSLRGAIMVFMFILPAVPAISGNFFLPMQLGAKDVAFPRLDLLSWWLYVTGGLFFMYVLFSGVFHSITGMTLPGGFGLD